jgi:hypothetical protein
MSLALVVQREVSEFIDAAQVIDLNFDVKYEKSEISIQYRNFAERISEIGKEENSENLTSRDCGVNDEPQGKKVERM